MANDIEPKSDSPFMRKLFYTGLRLRKAARKLVLDITPPIITRLFIKKKTSKAKRNAIVGAKSGRPFTIDDMPPAEYNYMNGSPKIELPISHLRYSGGLRFDNDQHHFVRYLSHGVSALEKFYKIHQPKNILEKHFVNSDKNSDLPLKGLPWVMYGDGNFDRNITVEKGLPASHGHQHHGPVSPQKITLEASHLDRLRDSFKKNGLLENDDLPTGHFIIDDNGDWAFYIKDGQHRISVMAHLGYETAIVKITGGTIAAVTSNTARDWPMVRRGMLTEKEALSILRAYTSPDRQLKIFED